MTKHFPGGGPQKDGEDPHFPHGKEQVYPGGIRPPPHALRGGLRRRTAQIMPYYGCRSARSSRRSASASTGSRHGAAARAARLRRRRVHRLGAGHRRGSWAAKMPARAWGVEHLERDAAGAEGPRRRSRPVRRRDLPGGARRTRPRRAASGDPHRRLGAAPAARQVPARPVRRPYVDPERPRGSSAAPVPRGRRGAQRRSIVLLKNGTEAALRAPVTGDPGSTSRTSAAACRAVRRGGRSARGRRSRDRAAAAPYEQRDRSSRGSSTPATRLQGAREGPHPGLFAPCRPSSTSTSSGRPSSRDRGEGERAARGLRRERRRTAGRRFGGRRRPASCRSSCRPRWRRSAPEADVPHDSATPLFPFGFGLTYSRDRSPQDSSSSPRR